MAENVPVGKVLPQPLSDRAAPGKRIPDKTAAAPESPEPTFTINADTAEIFRAPGHARGPVFDAMLRNPEVLAGHQKAFVDRIDNQGGDLFARYPDNSGTFTEFPQKIPDLYHVAVMRKQLTDFGKGLRIPADTRPLGPAVRNNALLLRRLQRRLHRHNLDLQAVHPDVRSTDYTERGYKLLEDQKQFERNIPFAGRRNPMHSDRVTRNDREHPRFPREKDPYFHPYL